MNSYSQKQNNIQRHTIFIADWNVYWFRRFLRICVVKLTFHDVAIVVYVV